MPHSRKSWPHRLRRLCLFLILGVATTWAVAWGLALLSTTSKHVPSSPAFVGDRGIVWSAQEQTGATFVVCWDWPRNVPKALNHPPIPTRSVQIPSWVMSSPRRTPQSPLEEHTYRFGSAAFGWPFKSACKDWADEGSTLHHTHSLIWREADSRRYPPRDASIPLRSYWPGLAFNTLFYALLSWLVFASLRMVRHNRRYRRGLCPLCRYDLLADYSNGCSECGWHKP